MNDLKKSFSAVRFLGLAHTHHGSAFPYNLLEVQADFDGAVLENDGANARLRVDVLTPFLHDSIANLFNAQSVRIGCTTHINLLIYMYTRKPANTLLSDDLKEVLSRANPYYFEIHHTDNVVQIVPVSDLDELDANNIPMLLEVLKTLYFPAYNIVKAVMEFRENVNFMNGAVETLQQNSINEQIQNDKGNVLYIATLKDEQGNTKNSHHFKAYGLINAATVAQALFTKYDIIGVQQVI